MNDRSDVRRGLLEARVAALAVVILGIVCVIGASQIRTPGGYTAVSAGAMPIAVGVGLIALGLLLLLRATARPDLDHAARVAAEAVATHWPTTLAALAGLVAYALVLGPLGYVVATALFVPAEARVLGSRSAVRDVAVGAVLALVVYLAFTQFLGVRLPAGVLDPILP